MATQTRRYSYRLNRRTGLVLYRTAQAGHMRPRANRLPVLAAGLPYHTWQVPTWLRGYCQAY